MQKHKLNLFLVCITWLIGSQSIAQQFSFHLEYFSNQKFNEEINKADQIIHVGLKPLILPKLSEIKFDDSLEYIDYRDQMFSKPTKSGWFYRKLRNESFIDLKTEDFRLKINPLLNLELKYDTENTKDLFINTRGIELKGDIAKNIFFYSSFYENQARYEPYVNDYIQYYLVVPGQGAPKFKKNNMLDFSMASAYLFMNMGKYLGIQFGHSKQFIGEGYRSVLLSDNAFNYPFLKLTGTYGKFQYTMLWSQHELFGGAYYNYHFRKYNAISYLSWVPKNGIELSFVENIIWPGNLPGMDNFSLNFFNPLMFWRTIQYGLNHDKNVILGFNARIKLDNFAQAYGQFALDRTDRDVKANNNFAFQLGFKQFNLLHRNLSRHKIFTQFEFNYISPYTYTHSKTVQTYTHYNQPLAHPTGTGLKESIGIFCYSFKDFNIRILASHLINSMDTTNTNFGSDLFFPNEPAPELISHTGNKPGQGIKNKTLKLNTDFTFLINPSYNLEVFARLVYRKRDNSLIKQEYLVFSFGLRTNLNNYYYDF